MPGAHLLIETSLPAGLTAATSSADDCCSSVLVCRIAMGRPSLTSVAAFDSAAKSKGDHRSVYIVCISIGCTSTVLIHNDEEIQYILVTQRCRFTACFQ